MSASADGAAIEVPDRPKRCGELHAARGISFAVRQGEVFGMLGLNGAGKTTTIELVEGLRRADNGRAIVLGHGVARRPLGGDRGGARRRRRGRAHAGPCACRQPVVHLVPGRQWRAG